MKIKTRGVFLRRAACIGLTIAIGATYVAGQVLASADGASSVSASAESLNFENVTGKVDLTGIRLENMSGQVLENTDASTTLNATRTLIVKLDGDSLLEGGKLSEIESGQKSFLSQLKQAGVSYTLKSSYNTVLNAVAIETSLSSVSSIRALDGVSAVSDSVTYARPEETADDSGSGAQTNYSNIYKSGIYDSSEWVNQGYDGTGMTVAVLDTGLDYTHEAFSATHLKDASQAAFSYDYIAETMSNTTFKAADRSGASAADVYVSAKVPFAYDYADDDSDVYPSYSQHGTHVAGIIAGKMTEEDDRYTDADGNAIDEIFTGVAPEAQLVICKVFTDDLDDSTLGSAETVDILDALEDCCKLGVDVINMSLGTSGGFSSSALLLDSEGEIMNGVYENIRNSGISLVAAASNDYSAAYGGAFGTNLASNPDSGTVGSPSTYSGAMSVASINGQKSPYIVANATVSGGTVSGGEAVYYEDSRNEDSEAYSFLDDMLGEDGSVQSKTYKYVVVPGTGAPGDYTSTIKSQLADDGGYAGVIAVIKRGTTSFKDKIETASRNGADAVIVYNNVSGTVRMSLGDMQTHVPAISVSMDAGLILTNGRKTGTITIDRDYAAGPFMNDYSSWGTTADLKLKPDVTAHGGEIISTVAGGYDEMSGTSMASPNLAGFTTILKGYLKNNHTELWSTASELTNLTNNIIMSTATIVYDQNKLPYSPRKQGAGLATLKNVFSTSAYLYTAEEDEMCEDGRPKAELGEDEDKNGEYNIKFYVRNFGSEPLTFRTNTIFMTETLGADGKSVAEKAYLFDSKASWKADGHSVAEGGTITVAAGTSVKVEATLKLSASEKKYLDDTFKNGMFVEGFLQLLSDDSSQCDLSLPFLAFYGDWDAAPLLDYDCYEIAEFEKDSSLNDNTRPQASVWATQAYTYYWNDKYTTPLGSFLYVQDEDKEHTSEYIYTEAEHSAISCYNYYYGADDENNYLTITGIKALYAGLLRNAEVVTYTLTNEDTGEVIAEEKVYRVSKAYAGGGSNTPALVLLELKTEELGLAANGKYRIDFDFYFKYTDYYEENGTDDTFTMSFYVDYEAPVLVDSRIRFQDRKDENGKVTQKVYLDLDVFDNHYPQAVMLCYTDTDGDVNTLKLATEYVTPVLNAKKNGTTTVSIEITDLYETYKGMLYVEVDDYALNHNIYAIDLNYSSTSVCPADFTFSAGSEITIQKNKTATLTIDNLGSASLSNFIWSTSNSRVVKVKNGEIFGVSAGTARVTAVGANGKSQAIKVTVTESDATIKLSSVSFGTILNTDDTPVLASGTVEVNSGQKISLSITPDPWYFPIDDAAFTWKSGDETIATVDEDGNVEIIYEGDKIKTVTITATYSESSSVKAEVTLSVQDPYTVSNGTLTRYRGTGGELTESIEICGETYTNVRVLTFPKDKSITSIGEGAFEDCDSVEVVVIPKSVTTIGESAFENCKNLKMICFISTEDDYAAESSLNIIYRYAFKKCPNLVCVDLSNCKVITLDRNVFTDCVALKEVKNMQAVGTAGDEAFKGCTALESVDISGLHVAGASLFEGCTALAGVTAGSTTALGSAMFKGCTALSEVRLSSKTIPDYAFYGCSKLTKVTIDADVDSIGAYAFAGCSAMTSVNLGTFSLGKIGDKAFSNCFKLDSGNVTALCNAELGIDVFENVGSADGAVYSSDNTKLIKAPETINSSFSLPASVTAIGPYAFSGSTLEQGVTLTLDLSNVTEIGAGAFYNLKGLTSVTLGNIDKIPDYAFYGTGLTSITIPASVTEIGAGAFSGCSQLSEVTFAEGSRLTKIGDRAFYGITAAAVTLPDGAASIGSEAFAGNASLTTAYISSVTEMGEGAFMGCPLLSTVTFGQNAKTTGDYTFLSVDAASGSIVTGSLTSVTLGEGITALGAGVFAYNGALQTIDLKNVTSIGDEAFYGCTSLTTVTGLEKVGAVGSNAFAYCTALTSADLTSAESIYYSAFFNCSSLAQVTFGSGLKGIGDESFAESALTQVTIPASCTYVGVSAFSGIRGLKAYAVSDGNSSYFAEDGVLYRTIADGTYELVSYPAGKSGVADADGVSSYTVKEGTVTIQAFAFYGVSVNALGAATTQLNKVILPYTLKTIGNGAFLYSGINTYEFESIAAPVLLEGLVDGTSYSDSPYSFYYTNFNTGIADFVARKPGDSASAVSTLTIRYPTNGTGYDNYVYSHYFGTKVLLGEMPEEAARTLKTIIEALESVQTVSSWTKDTPVATVQDCADRVKEAHRLYNTISSRQSQLDYVGQENIDKLFAVEAALKPVKEAVGISVSIQSIGVDESSTHKSEYKEGETFKLGGLKILVTYDDYSQEVVDAADYFVLSEDYDRKLWTTDSAVLLVGTGDYEGLTLSVKITVTEGSGAGAGSANIVAIVVPVVCAAVVLAAAAAVLVILKKKGKIGGKRGKAESAEEEEASGESEAESEENELNLQDGEKGTDD